MQKIKSESYRIILPNGLKNEEHFQISSKREREREREMPDNYSSRIEYSEKYSDDKYEYRYVNSFFFFYTNQKKNQIETFLKWFRTSFLSLPRLGKISFLSLYHTLTHIYILYL